MTAVDKYPYEYLINESQSLISRLQQVKPFSMTMPMVKGASISVKALEEIIGLLEKGKREIHTSITKFIEKVNTAKQQQIGSNELQTAFTIQKLRYNSILDQLDIFADVLSQRGEHDVGIWLSGLDVLAEDGLTVCKNYFDIPPLMVFLERGHGAAIRRARTRLPGGDENPVAVIQIPRERMVGSGIASSLIHEVGHQAAEGMELTKGLRIELGKKIESATKNKIAWKHYERWISEILADCWAMGHLGISATLGLMGVVTLPKYFQFRLDLDDPHPAPYVRVKLSCAFGKALFPHLQWDKVWQMWQTFYPTNDLPNDKKILLKMLDEEESSFVQLVLSYKSDTLRGKQLAQLFPYAERQPTKLQQLFVTWKNNKQLINKATPTMVFAVLGQAKFDQTINAEQENKLLTQQLSNWAYTRK
jgi:hypothetical protein